jgi:signal transduction histidine kinase
VKYFYLLLNGSVAITLFGLGIIALINDRRSFLNRLFLLFTLCVSIWIIAAYVSNDTTYPPIVSLVGNYLVFFFSYFSSYLLLLFAVRTTNSSLASKILKKLAIPIILIGLLSGSPLVVAGVEAQGNVYAVNFGPLVLVYGISLIGLLTSSLIVLGLGFRKTVGRERQQIRTVFWSWAIALPILLVTQFIAPAFTGSFEMTDIGILAMVLPVVGLYYSVIRHGLFDIRLAAVRTVAYLLALASLASIYYLMAYITSGALFEGGSTGAATSVSPINIMLALVLAFIFQPVKLFFDRVTDRIFYQDTYNSEEFFAELSELLASTTDLRGLLSRASQEIATTFKAEQTFFFLYYSNAVTHHLTSGTQGHAKLPLYDAHTLNSYIETHKQDVFVTDLLGDEDREIKRLLISHKIAILMPLKHRDDTIGYLCLGDRLTGSFTDRDLKTLTTISAELVIAIQNALSVHEVREINASLQQRIHVATAELRESNAQLHRLDAAKDEFVSMASHQLRTPLTSVKGYISMMLDGDVGEISEVQRNALKEAFNSSERMVRLIGDFLSVSRLQTGKFVIEKKPTDLVKVVEQEVDGLRIIASTHGLKLAYAHPKHLPMISLDEAKIRQVIMNFIDNAIYYSRQNSTIHIALGKLEDEVVFTVEDTGIGVPVEEQRKLFTKFYRASNARQQRPDGTGVGLFLAKKIITAHDGKVVFSSIEGHGSTFGFRMPLVQKLSDPDDQQNQHK